MNFGGVDFDTYLKNYPSNDGYFGKYGGVYVSDELKAAMKEICEAYSVHCCCDAPCADGAFPLRDWRGTH